MYQRKGYEKLTNGVIEEAVKDYRKAARFLARHPRTRELEETVARQRVEKEKRREERLKLNLPAGRKRQSKEERLLDRICSKECEMKEIEHFFCSQWFGRLTNIDGQWLLERLKREQEDD